MKCCGIQNNEPQMTLEKTEEAWKIHWLGTRQALLLKVQIKVLLLNQSRASMRGQPMWVDWDKTGSSRRATTQYSTGWGSIEKRLPRRSRGRISWIQNQRVQIERVRRRSLRQDHLVQTNKEQLQLSNTKFQAFQLTQSAKKPKPEEGHLLDPAPTKLATTRTCRTQVE